MLVVVEGEAERYSRRSKRLGVALIMRSNTIRLRPLRICQELDSNKQEQNNGPTFFFSFVRNVQISNDSQ